MNSVEMTTIIDAMAKKQTWIKKNFNDFLDTWRKITNDMDEEEIYICDYQKGSLNHEVYLVTNEDSLYYRKFTEWGEDKEMDYYTEDGCSSCNYKDALTIDIIRTVTPCLSVKITEHFKSVQSDIDCLSEHGQELKRLSDLLK